MSWKTLRSTLAIEFLPQPEPEDIYQEMVESLYVGLPSILGGAALGAFVVIAAAEVCDQPLLWAAAYAMAVVGALRVALVFAFQRTMGNGRSGYDLRPWEYAYAVGAVAFSLLLGVCGLLTLRYTNDQHTVVSMSTFVMGYSCGIAGRNNQRPWISSLQMWLSMGPMLCNFTPWDFPWTNYVVGTLVLFASLRKDVSRFLYDHHKAYYANRAAKRKVEGEFDLALANMGHGIALYDRDARIVFANARMGEILRLPQEAFTPGTLPGDTFSGCHSAGLLGREACIDLAARFALGVTKSERRSFEQRLGDGRTVELTFNPIEAGEAGEVGGTVVAMEDITERKTNAARIEHLARYDSLTDLPNRFSFKDRLSELLHRGEQFAVLAIDLDRFKAVNDTLGHSVGDKLLRQVAARLREMTGPHDLVSRFGGDEFMVILGLLNAPDDAALFARRVVQALSKPYQVDQHSLIIGASAGIALAPSHSDEAESLLQYADMALYRVKEKSRGTYMFFDASMDAAAREKRAIEIDLRHAIERNELQVHFQPQYNLNSGSFTTCEALIRWIHPTRGFVGPDKFIKVAEETGMIVEIGEWVLRQACLAAKAWPNDMRVAVNLSAVQFQTGNLVQTVHRVLRETGFPAHRLELEVTESLLMGDVARNGAIMRELKDMRVRISLDDFGTGYSSLSYLQMYPFNKVKMDKAFADAIEKGENRNGEAIIKAVATLSREMGMSVTVEGIETQRQVDVVRSLGCTDIQGWFYSKALPQPALLDFLAKAGAERSGALAA